MTSLIEESGDLINASCDDLYSKDKTVLFSPNNNNNQASGNLINHFSNHSASCGLSTNKQLLYSTGQPKNSSSNYYNHHHQHFHNHHHQTNHFASTSLSSSPSSSVSSTLSYGSNGLSRNESGNGKSDFHIVGGKIRPTLKCIRNTLNLGIDSIKRYDRLSSSKCDINDLTIGGDGGEFISSTSTIDEEPIFSDDCCFTPSSSTSFTPDKLNNTAELLTTQDVIVNPLASCISNLIANNNNPININTTELPTALSQDNLAQIQSDPSASTIQQQLPVTAAATNTFRSFIKTKSTKGIMLRKDSCNEDDDEVVKLCEGDNNDEGNGSKIDLTFKDPFEKFSGKSKQSASGTGSSQSSKHHGSSSRSTSKTSTSSSTNSSTHHHPQCSRSYSQSSSSNSRHHHHHHQQQLVNCSSNNNGSNKSGNGQPCCQASQQQQQSCATLPAETINSSNPSNNKKLYSNGKNMSKLSNQSKASSFSASSLSSQTSHYPLNSQNPSPQKRSSRTNLIPPLLKSSRFTKNSSSTSSKGNLLFNAISHRSSSHKGSNSCKSPKKLQHQSMSCNVHDSSREVVESLKSDRMVMTQPDEDRRRRTIIIEKQNSSFGFTLQTYGIKHSREGEVELITYVDEVAYGGPAFRGGMRPGDVILSINGRDVEKADHRTLVNFISACEKTMRLVVLFEDCVRKIELHLKFIKLKKSLQQKMAQLEILNQKENQLLLNAAVRTCNEKNCCNNNNVIGIQNCPGTNFVQSSKDDFFEQPGQTILGQNNNNNGQLKKYKCKSLEISLDEINCNSNSGTNGKQQFSGDKWILGGDGTGDDCANSNNNVDNCFDSQDKPDQFHHSTTLPRAANNNNPSSTEQDLFDGFQTCPIVLESIPTEGTLFQQQQSRSKSLPHSMANSLDCLTNEAYEDDEDVLIDTGKDLENEDHNFAQNHHPATWDDDPTGCLTFCNDSTTFTEPQKHRTIIFEQPASKNIIGNKKLQHITTSDKDFITKL